eukprot:231448-Hanusia_phi.AAC.1
MERRTGIRSSSSCLLRVGRSNRGSGFIAVGVCGEVAEKVEEVVDSRGRGSRRRFGARGDAAGGGRLDVRRGNRLRDI